MLIWIKTRPESRIGLRISELLEVCVTSKAILVFTSWPFIERFISQFGKHQMQVDNFDGS